MQQFLWKNNAIYLHVNGKRIRYSDPLYARIDRQSAFAFQIGGGLRPMPMPEGNVNLFASHMNEAVARDRYRSESRAAMKAAYLAGDKSGGANPGYADNVLQSSLSNDGAMGYGRDKGSIDILDEAALADAANSSDVNSWAYEPGEKDKAYAGGDGKGMRDVTPISKESYDNKYYGAPWKYGYNPNGWQYQTKGFYYIYKDPLPEPDYPRGRSIEPATRTWHDVFDSISKDQLHLIWDGDSLIIDRRGHNDGE